MYVDGERVYLVCVGYGRIQKFRYHYYSFPLLNRVNVFTTNGDKECVEYVIRLRCSWIYDRKGLRSFISERERELSACWDLFGNIKYSWLKVWYDGVREMKVSRIYEDRIFSQINKKFIYHWGRLSFGLVLKYDFL